MSTQHVTIGQLRAMLGGSQRAHEDLVRGCLDLLAMHRIPATPISTTGIPVQRSDGSLALKTNEEQEGFSDIVLCLPPMGRMGLFEVKTGKAKRTPAQREMQARYKAAGALVLEIRSIDDVQRMLQQYSPTRRT